MTAYAGQTMSGEIALLRSEEERGFTPELLFTEHDRRRAHRDLTEDNPLMHFDLYVRLRTMADLGSHQAEWYINALHDKARNQGRAIIESLQAEN